ncbi:MAG TPA: phosphoglucosamine mutase [Candidatus Deferrimicrobium sp.]|nr:phosphoglucosamine mutase [Candidatus Deferrimicrobium sp.]
MGKLFGTDGVRGVANSQLTPQLAFKLGQAGAYVLSKAHSHPRIVIGRDTRISGSMLEAALIAGICSVGADVLTVGVLPTPGIAYLTRNLEATAGVVISASHNPVEDNGIKFFSASGHKLPDTLEDEIEEIVSGETCPWNIPVGEEVGRVIEVVDPVGQYVNYLKTTIDCNLNGLKVVMDCANGAAYEVAPRVLRELGAEVIPMFHEPDGVNINKKCGSTHPEELQRAVVRHQAHIGLANDGDADRLIAVDEQGNIVDGDFIMVICASFLKERGELALNSLVTTVMSNMGLYIALKNKGINVLETKVGDRYVMEELLKSGAKFGGEQSGHIIFLNYNTTGDGVCTALQLLRVMHETGKSLSELATQMTRLPQVLKNVRVNNKTLAMEAAEVLLAIETATAKLDGRGRVLVRPSGTEPLVRVMAEGPDMQELNLLVDQVVDTILKIAE